MKKMSEVCKITGFSRQILQRFDQYGLVKHSAEKGKYWYYDEDAINKLFLVRIFDEAGYDRKDTKKVLDSPKIDMLQEFDILIDTLTQKQKRINGMIQALKMFKSIKDLPKSTFQGIMKLDISNFYQNQSFHQMLDDMIRTVSESNDPGDEQFLSRILFFYTSLIAIASDHSRSVENEDVQSAVRDTYNALSTLIDSEEDEAEIFKDVELSAAEEADWFLECITDFLKDLELCNTLDTQCGKGSSDYILQAIRFYRDSIVSAE